MELGNGLWSQGGFVFKHIIQKTKQKGTFLWGKETCETCGMLSCLSLSLSHKESKLLE